MKYATVIVYNTPLHPSCHTFDSLEDIDNYIKSIRDNMPCLSINKTVFIYELSEYGFGRYLKEIVI